MGAASSLPATFYQDHPYGWWSTSREIVIPIEKTSNEHQEKWEANTGDTCE